MIPVWLQVVLGLMLYLQFTFMFYYNEVQCPEEERVTDLSEFKVFAAAWPILTLGIWVAVIFRIVMWAILPPLRFLANFLLDRLERRFGHL